MNPVINRFMAQVTSVAQHILTLEPDKDAARLCFYHFLKNLCEATEPVNSALLERFFLRALTFQHWQQNKAALFREVTLLLQHFQDSQKVQLPITTLLSPADIQVVELENQRLLGQVLEGHFERSIGSGDQFRILHEPNRAIVVVLSRSRGLKVGTYPSLAVIRDGQLAPLCHDFTVSYSPSLELAQTIPQQAQVGPHSAARFRVTSEGIFGYVVRGYTLNRYAAFEGGGLHKYPILFYPLKRLEQFFVDRKTDPMYVELTNLLEKAIELLSHGSGRRDPERHADAVRFAGQALERARLALEHIFPDDKLVRFQIGKLEESLALESADDLSKDESWPQKHQQVRNLPV